MGVGAFYADVRGCVIRTFCFLPFLSVSSIWVIPANVCCVIISLAVWTMWVCFCIWFFRRLFFTVSSLLFANVFSAFFNDIS